MRKTLALVLCVLSGMALADAPPAVQQLQKRWAEIKYGLKGDAQETAYAELAREAERMQATYPRAPEALIWEGIVLSSYAGAKGGLGALSLAKKAKEAFEAAIAVDGNSLHGSAYTSLGTLYYMVPGWPLGFGDDEKAREYLGKGLAANPDGIDSNFFWGDFLHRKGEHAEAAKALQKALAAPPRPGRETADAGRRTEIRELLAKLAQESAK